MKIKDEFIVLRNTYLCGEAYDSNSPTGRNADQDAFKKIQKKYPQVNSFFDLEKAVV